MNLGFADALCRRLLSARRATPALRLRAVDRADMYDVAFGIVRRQSRSAAQVYFFFRALRFFFAFAFAAFFALFAILPS